MLACILVSWEMNGAVPGLGPTLRPSLPDPEGGQPAHCQQAVPISPTLGWIYLMPPGFFLQFNVFPKLSLLFRHLVTPCWVSLLFILFHEKFLSWMASHRLSLFPIPCRLRDKARSHHQRNKYLNYSNIDSDIFFAFCSCFDFFSYCILW